MRDLFLTVTFSYNEAIMHDDDENSITTFRDCVLLNEEEPLVLYSKALEAELGTVRVLRIDEPDSFAVRLAASQAETPMSPGRFISIEGIDGAGRTTLMTHLHQLLTTAGCRVVVTRDPGGTAWMLLVPSPRSRQRWSGSWPSGFMRKVASKQPKSTEMKNDEK